MSQNTAPEITTRFTPRANLETLVREIGVRAKTRPEWDAEIDKLETFCRLTPEETAWLAGVRYLGNYVRPYV